MSLIHIKSKDNLRKKKGLYYEDLSLFTTFDEFFFCELPCYWYEVSINV